MQSARVHNQTPTATAIGSQLMGEDTEGGQGETTKPLPCLPLTRQLQNTPHLL
jgi:hypothetical protein